MLNKDGETENIIPAKKNMLTFGLRACLAR